MASIIHSPPKCMSPFQCLIAHLTICANSELKEIEMASEADCNYHILFHNLGQLLSET